MAQFTEDFSNILSLARWLDSISYFAQPDDAIDFFAGPLSYKREYGLFRMHEQATKDGHTDLADCIESAVDDDDQNADLLEFSVFTEADSIDTYKLERRYNSNPPQPDEWSWCHEDYDGPGDKRCGVARSAAEAIALIKELDQ